MHLNLQEFNSHNPLVIIQPTPFCNLDCQYCYLPNRNLKQQMSLDVLERIFDEVLKSSLPDPIELVWHAGEPLAVSKDFYRKAFQILNQINLKYNRKLLHGIQTNATLIDEEWINLFQENQIHIGVSIDGPDFIHDRYRVTHTGYGTHKKTMRGIKLLQKNQIPFNTISVLTDFSLDYPYEMFAFFVENEIQRVAFNIDEISGENLSSSYELEQAIYKYKKFIHKFAELVDSNNGIPEVREFVQITSSIKNNPHGKGILINSTNIPFHVITFDYQGNYTTFCPELLATKSSKFDNFIMGNILQNEINSISENSIFKAVNSEIQTGLKACRESCEYWYFCGGGSPSNKFSETGRFDVTETLHCRVHRKALVDSILDYLESKKPVFR
ncbi:MAG: GRRM system radical SAM/SPASM domain protein [Nodularia sp. (in: Bacteria)]|nr:MAG: GRRM system radical SAM/SPASM domain protein [Nodularia sp. (in: cyanobacteria)]